MRNVDIPVKTHQLYNSSSHLERSNSGEKNNATLKRKSVPSYPKTSSQKKKDGKTANFQPTLKDVYLFDRELSEFESEEKRIQEELSKNQNLIPPDNSPKTTISVDAIEDDIFILVNEIERLNSIINQGRVEAQIYKDKYSQLQQNLFTLGLDEEQLGLAIKEALATENNEEVFSTFRKESPKNLLNSEEIKKIKQELESWKNKYFELINSQNSESTESNIHFAEQENSIRALERKLELITNENAQLKTFIESYNFEADQPRNQQIQQGKEVLKSVDLLIAQRNRLEIALEEKKKEAEEWKQKFHEIKMTTVSEGDNSLEVMKYLTAENQKLSRIIRQTQKDLETLKLKAPEFKEYHKLNEELKATLDEITIDQSQSKHLLSPILNPDINEEFAAQDQMMLTRTASKFKTPNLSVVEEKLEITGQASVEINTSVLLKDIETDESDKKPPEIIPPDGPETKSYEDPSQRIFEIEKQLYLEQQENKQLREALELKNLETKKLYETKIDLDKLRLENRKIIDKYKTLRLEKKMLETLIMELRNQVKLLSQELNNVTKDQSKFEERGSSKIESLSSENQRLNKLFMEKLVEIQKLNDRINERDTKLEELQEKDKIIESLKLKLSALENHDGQAAENIENKIFVLVEEIEKLNAIINEKDQLLETYQNATALQNQEI